MLTVKQAAEMTGYSRQTITRLFEQEKGVLVLERECRGVRRGYRNIRIPREVFDRVIGKIRR